MTENKTPKYEIQTVLKRKYKIKGKFGLEEKIERKERTLSEVFDELDYIRQQKGFPFLIQFRGIKSIQAALQMMAQMKTAGVEMSELKILTDLPTKFLDKDTNEEIETTTWALEVKINSLTDRNKLISPSRKFQDRINQVLD